MTGKPLDQGHREIAHDFAIAIGQVLLHGTNRRQHLVMLINMAVTSRKTFVFHPAILLLKVSFSMCRKYRQRTSKIGIVY